MPRDEAATPASAPMGLSPLARVLIALVRGYQYLISPLLPPACRFYPTCSHYSIDAIESHGAMKGGLLTVWRLLKCHPLHPGGFDPVLLKRSAAPARLWDGRAQPTRIHH